jgi:tricorn protease
MMPRWEDVSSRASNLAISPTGRRAVVEARGEIFTIPVKRRRAEHHALERVAERDPAWSPDGKYISYFSDKSGEYRLVLEEPDGLSPPREIVLPKPTHYYTPSWSPDSKKLMYSDTNLNVWVLDIATGQTKDRRPRSVDGAGAHAQSTWSPGLEVDRVRRPPAIAASRHFVSNVETGETKQMTDGLADAVGPRGMPAASTCGSWRRRLRPGSQWLDMTSYDHNQTFGLYFAILKKGEPTPLMPESDEDPGIRPGAPGRAVAERSRRRRPGRRRGGRLNGGAGTATRACRVPSPFKSISTTSIAASCPCPASRRAIIHVSSPAAPASSITWKLPRRRRGHACSGIAERRRAAPFVTGVADYVVSADTHKLLYRGGAGGGGGRGGGGGGAPAGPRALHRGCRSRERRRPARAA